MRWCKAAQPSWAVRAGDYFRRNLQDLTTGEFQHSTTTPAKWSIIMTYKIVIILRIFYSLRALPNPEEQAASVTYSTIKISPSTYFYHLSMITKSDLTMRLPLDTRTSIHYLKILLTVGLFPAMRQQQIFLRSLIARSCFPQAMAMPT